MTPGPKTFVLWKAGDPGESAQSPMAEWAPASPSLGSSLPRVPAVPAGRGLRTFPALDSAQDLAPTARGPTPAPRSTVHCSCCEAGTEPAGVCGQIPEGGAASSPALCVQVLGMPGPC